MLTPIQGEDDRLRGLKGLVLSVAQREDGTLRLSLDRVSSTSTTLPNHWDFRVFDGHFEIDTSFLDAVENELRKSENERSDEGMGVPDAVLQSIGHAFLVRLLVAAQDARKAGPI